MSAHRCIAELELERLREQARHTVNDNSYLIEKRFFEIILAREKELGLKGRDSFLYCPETPDADVPFQGDAACTRSRFFLPPDRWLGATSASSQRSRSAPAESRPLGRDTARVSDSVVSRPRSEAAESEALPSRPGCDTAQVWDSVVSRPRSEAAESEALPSRPPRQEYWKEEGCGGEADAPPPPPPRSSGLKSNQCADCNGMFMASEVMIDVDIKDVGYDWQGHLPKRCF